MARPKAKHETMGARLGPRIAALTARAMADHLRHTADTRAKIGAQAAIRFMGTITDESRPHVAPLAEMIAGDESLPPFLRDLFGFMAAGRGEWQALLAYSGVAAGVSTSFGQLIGNWLAPFVHDQLSRAPNTWLTPAAAADLANRGIWDIPTGRREAAGSGVSAERFNALLIGAAHYPDEATILELLRRGILSTGQAQATMKLLGYSDNGLADMLQLRHVLLSPEQAADMALRGVISEEEGVRIAGLQGVDATDFHRLVLDTGEPPGTDQLTFAYRRGIIDRQRLERGIRQSRTRNEWIDVVEALRFVPMDTSDAIRAAVQNHLSEGDAKRIAEENGLNPAHFTPLLETAGNPPGPMEMISLLNRGRMTQAEVEQGLRESRLKNKYIPHFLELRRRLPAERQLLLMIEHGVIGTGDAEKHLTELGYNATDAHRLVLAGRRTATHTERHAAKGDVLALYREGGIGRHQAAEHLKALNYPQEDIDLLLELEDRRREHAEQRAAQNRIRALYVAYHLDRGEASGQLDRLHVPHVERDRLLSLWGLERQASARHLSPTQLATAVTRGIIDRQEGTTKIVRQGYSARDAEILIELHAPHPRGGGQPSTPAGP